MKKFKTLYVLIVTFVYKERNLIVMKAYFLNKAFCKTVKSMVVRDFKFSFKIYLCVQKIRWMWLLDIEVSIMRSFLYWIEKSTLCLFFHTSQPCWLVSLHLCITSLLILLFHQRRTADHVKKDWKMCMGLSYWCLEASGTK
jgi:hypothetical protein